MMRRKIIGFFKSFGRLARLESVLLLILATAALYWHDLNKKLQLESETRKPIFVK